MDARICTSERGNAYVLFVFHFLDASEVVRFLLLPLVLSCSVHDLHLRVVEVHLQKAAYHHLTIILPSSYHHLTIILPSSYHHLTIIIPSSYHHLTIILPSSYHHLTIILPSSYHHLTIILPSSYHQVSYHYILPLCVLQARTVQACMLPSYIRIRSYHHI